MRLLREHFYILIVIALLGAFAIALFEGNRAIDRILLFSARQNATSLSQAITAFRNLYTENVIQKVVGSDFEITHDHHNKAHAIPLPVTLSIEIGAHIGELGGGASANIYSPYPFPWRLDEGGLQDDFQTAAWNYLMDNPRGEFVRSLEVDGEPVIRYARADVMSASCVGCHNSHPRSPRNDWKIGDVRGIIEVMQPIRAITDNASDELTRTNWLLSLSMLLGLAGIFAVVAAFRWRLAMHKKMELSLASSNTELLRTNEELDQFAYRSSHDLKAPLATVRGLANYIDRDIESGNLGEARTNSKRIAEQMKSLEALVVNMLALAQADTTDTPHERVDVSELVEAIVDRHRELIKESSVSIKTIINCGDRLLTQRSRLEQVLENLIHNGIKYADPDKAERFVEVSCDYTQTHCKLIVRDNGIGIPIERHAEVFTKFSRFHRQIADGSGLGLSLAKRHIDHLGGTIGFSSSPSGSEFVVEIPHETKRVAL
ncbi:MAG: ATP-binding protein [Pseudomonadota bacterium]